MTRDGMITSLQVGSYLSGQERYDIAAQLQADGETIARLEAALKPFVAWCEKLEAEFSDHAGDIVAASFNGVFVTFDDLRRARAALRPADKGDAT